MELTGKISNESVEFDIADNIKYLKAIFFLISLIFEPDVFCYIWKHGLGRLGSALFYFVHWYRHSQRVQINLSGLSSKVFISFVCSKMTF